MWVCKHTITAWGETKPDEELGSTVEIKGPGKLRKGTANFSPRNLRMLPKGEEGGFQLGILKTNM